MKVYHILGLIVFYTVCCESADLKNEDVYNNFQIQEEDYDFELNENDDAEENDVADLPTPADTVKINTVGQKFIKTINESVVLPCDITGSTYVLIWRKLKDFGSSLNKDITLFQEETPMAASPNMKLNKKSLEISPLRKEDAGVYQCKALNTQLNSPFIQHQLMIKAPPEIESLTIKDNITTLQIGSTLSLTCLVKSYPKARVQWYKDSRNLELPGANLVIKKVNHHNAGNYTCFAENNIGQAVFQSIEVKVEFKPVVSIDRVSMSSDHNVDTRLKCQVRSEPKATVVWKKNDVNLKNTEHTELFNEKNTHILLIKNITNSDFGEYTCFASNHLGSSKKSITLTNTPATFKFEKSRTESKDLLLTWKVQSKSPLLKPEIEYRRKGEASWIRAEPQVHSVDSETYEVQHVFKALEPGQYEAKIRSQNANGWSEYSEIITFEEAHSKHGHHKLHKKGHKEGKEKQVLPSENESTLSSVDAPAEQQEGDNKSGFIKDRDTDSSNMPSITSSIVLGSVLCTTVLSILGTRV